jgi:hypothetical protein
MDAGDIPLLFDVVPGSEHDSVAEQITSARPDLGDAVREVLSAGGSSGGADVPGHEMTKEEYAEFVKTIEPLEPDFFKVGNTWVVQNPSDRDLRDMVKEVRKELPNLPRGSVTIRSTRDERGNVWSWKANEATHFQIEPDIEARVGVDVNQNNDIPTHSEIIRDAIRNKLPVPKDVQAQYPQWKEFFLENERAAQFAEFDESKIKRDPKDTETGGRFTAQPKAAGAPAAEAAAAAEPTEGEGEFRLLPDGGIEFVPAGQPTEPEAAPEAEPQAAAGPVAKTERAAAFYAIANESMRSAAEKAGLRDLIVLNERDMEDAMGAKGIGGIYTVDGSMVLAEVEDEGERVRTIHHELAHALDSFDEATETHTVSESPEWLVASGWSKPAGEYEFNASEEDTVSAYAKTSPMEDFAESVRMFMSPDPFERRVMERFHPKRLEFVKRFLEAQNVAA